MQKQENNHKKNSSINPPDILKKQSSINPLDSFSEDIFQLKSQIFMQYSVLNGNHIKNFLSTLNFDIIKTLKQGGYGKILSLKSRFDNASYVAKVV